MFRIVASLLVVSQGTTLQRCNPQTKLKLGDGEVDVKEGCVTVGSDKPTSVTFCGPGKLTLSRMTCAKHEYKSHTYDHPTSQYTDNCETIQTADTNVEGWLGSYSIEC